MLCLLMFGICSLILMELFLKGVIMLVLSRCRDESIMIGDDVEIVIVDVRGDKVRLGIMAPENIPVHRKEIWNAIQQEKGKVKKDGG